jgi:hypothetical protein
MNTIKVKMRVNFMGTKRILTYIGLLLFCSGWAYTAHAAPQIEFEQTTFDCGDVKADTATTHAFAFKNIGDELLKIESLHSP